MRVMELAEGRYLVRLSLGEDLMASLGELARTREIGAAFVRGLGASRRARVAFYLMDEKRYDPIPVDGYAEVVSLLGNISWKEDGSPLVHVHATLGRPDGSTVAGHVLDLEVGATMELDLEVLPGRLVRVMDEEIGLPLLDRCEAGSGP